MVKIQRAKIIKTHSIFFNQMFGLCKLAPFNSMELSLYCFDLVFFFHLHVYWNKLNYELVPSVAIPVYVIFYLILGV